MSVRSSVEMPKVEFPKLERPKVELSPEATKVVEAIRDLAYLVVGAGATAVERADAARKDLMDRFGVNLTEGRVKLEDLRDQLELSIADAQDRYEALAHQVDEAVESFNDQLPEPVQKVAVQLHNAAKTAREQLRDRLAPAA